MTETKDFTGALPCRMNDILDLVSTNKLRVNVDAIDETRLMLGLQKIANGITMGLILAALIVCSAMLARIDTPFKIFGYPGVAMIFFLITGFGALTLMIQILFKDD